MGIVDRAGFAGAGNWMAGYGVLLGDMISPEVILLWDCNTANWFDAARSLTTPVQGRHAGAMLPVHAQALDQSDLLKLDAFLHSSACGRDAMGLSRAHGFLTAAASGPEQLEPGEWLRLVFDEPVFETGEQAEDMLGLAMRLYQHIETSLDHAGSYRPVLDFVRDGGSGMAVDATAWCQGYFSGMSLCRELWAMHAGSELNRLLAPIFELSRYHGASHDALHHRLCDELPVTAESVYRYWRAQGEQHSA